MFDKPSVQTIIKKSLKGNQKAMRSLFDLLTPTINFIAKRYLTDNEHLDEVIQETMIKVFDNLSKFDKDKGTIESWVYRITVNESLQFIRKQKRFHTVPLENESNTDIELSIDSYLTENEMIELVNHLQGNYKLVFNLFCIEGYSHKEISARLGITESSSRVFCSTAKKQLREVYQTIFLK